MESTEVQEIKTIGQLEAEVSKHFLIEDKMVIRVLCATVIANKMSFDPVWLMLVASSSGGKTELISALNGLDFVHQISDLTVNTFASGFKRSGQETSLLWVINGGIMTFKDFTSILSKSREDRTAIMGQMREIYDGEYIKFTGTGENTIWRGKVGAIAGSTEAIYQHSNDIAIMGDRFIMYSIKQPDRMAVARKAMSNTGDMKAIRQHMKDCFSSYISRTLENIERQSHDFMKLDEKTKDDILSVSDFATNARSAVVTDFKSGAVDFVPSAEMPMRMASQLFTIASSLMCMHKSEGGDGRLNSKEKKALYKIAFDSIPRSRKDILVVLAKYEQGVTTPGLATEMNLPTETVRKYLSQINARGLCSRSKRRNIDIWSLNEKYRKILVDLEDIKVIDGVLDSHVDGESVEAIFGEEVDTKWDSSNPYEEERVERSFDL